MMNLGKQKHGRCIPLAADIVHATQKKNYNNKNPLKRKRITIYNILLIFYDYEVL